MELDKREDLGKEPEREKSPLSIGWSCRGFPDFEKTDSWAVLGSLENRKKSSIRPVGMLSLLVSDAAIGVPIGNFNAFGRTSCYTPPCHGGGARSNGFNEESTMTKLDKVLYTAKAHTTGGRDGASRTDDGRLDVKLSVPGSAGAGTNPEQLFAAGWSACFIGAIRAVAGKKKVALPPDVAIDAEVDLGTDHGAYGLAARLNVSLPGLERQAAQELVDEAHQICPYSVATRGNIEVVITLV